MKRALFTAAASVVVFGAGLVAAGLVTGATGTTTLAPDTSRTDSGNHYGHTTTTTTTPTTTPTTPTTTTATTTTTQATATSFGQATVLGTPDSSNGGLLFGQPIQLSGAGTLQSMSFYVTNAAGTFRLGLYDNTGANGPGTLLAQSGDVTATTGWNTVTMPSVNLTAARYWIYVLPSSDNLAFVKTSVSGDNNPTAPVAYGSLPSPFPSTSTFSTSEWSFYATVSIAGGGGTTSTTTTTTSTTTTTVPTTTTAPTDAAFPLKVSSNGRYLVDQNGVPFLMVGDSPQSTIGMMSESETDRYFADRQAHGFNTVWINLLCADYTFCASDGRTWDGIAPFTSGSSPSTYDLSRPNPAYFQRVDDIINLAAAHGLLVVLDPIETGSWLTTMQNNGATKDLNYGTYLGSRYKSFQNIIWMSGNDYQDWWKPGNDAYVTAVAQGIQATDPQHIQTVELNYDSSGSLDDPAWVPLINLDAAYTYAPTYQQVLAEYNRANMPVFMVEAVYEFENIGTHQPGIPLTLRRQEYWTMLSGATGQLYGSYYTDRIANGWSAANVDSVGVTQLQHVTALFQGRAWWNLIPDQTNTFVTAGFGTNSSSDYATAALTPDGKLGMVYMPTSRAVTVNMAKMSGQVTAQWYDPTNGKYTSIGSFANTGSHQFPAPGNNSGGDSDWILVLTA